jgi:hypothetical protein
MFIQGVAPLEKKKYHQVNLCHIDKEQLANTIFAYGSFTQQYPQ